MTTAELIVGGFCGVVLLGIYIWIGIALYLGYTKGEELSAYFKNSSSLITVDTHKHTGPFGKLQLIGGIASVVTFPRFFVKRGLVSAEDIERFPHPCRRKLIVLQWSVIGLLATLVFLVSLWESGVLK
ncbi:MULTISPECIES: hypothetical protein [Pseudomonas]|jgi:hypothetical protein|uniref:Uncharacterized protein n=1 Tax=Pseudomonas umsongensis TaxID=198618 RepID=A0ABX4DPE4_9PSED|nr:MULTISPECIES: hypothetical protein [Pseudomonas]MBD0682418.1 hypothetical protein [Pseudomonas sp. PSB11]MCK8687808.1 hypothetical protein [Pseudomonas umsongensis]OXR28639.1 hypothetical protein PSUM_27045 [Pseudomonas umsongensis]QFG32048.1 hypothetical protein F6476_24205 [Pseudomonas umsongensis]